jgi:hypothetical protein
MNIEDLVRTLKMRGGYEVVRNNSGANQVRLIGRVPSQLVKGWLIIVQQLLVRNEQAPWSADISKQYFLQAGRVMFGWRLIFQGEDIKQHFVDIITTITNSPRPRATVEEQPLAGASASRNRQTPGSLKGAAPAGKAVVGRMASQLARG